MLAPCPSPKTCNIPGALQQVLQRIEEQGNANLRASELLYSLKADLENRWRMASSEGLTSSTMLYQVLEYGWEELLRITA
jgi:hypothetical protein